MMLRLFINDVKPFRYERRVCLVSARFAGSIPALGELHPEQIRFVLGTAGFLLSRPPLFDFGTIRP
jgi:hypothetical protein